MFYFTCRPMNLEYMKVSQFEINYKKEINLTQYSYFLRSTCIQFVYIDNKKKILITDIENVSVTYVTLVPWRRERRRHVGGPTNWDIA